MTLLETTKLLEWLAKQQPNINGVVESGDIFDLNKDSYEQKYAAFCVTQNTHNVGLDFTTYSFTLFYVDRLTLDKKNKLEVQSDATEFFANLMKTIAEKYPTLDWTSGDVTTFAQRFSAECAGAFMTMSITTTNTSLCAIWKESEVVTKGEFNPQEFSDEFFLWARNYV